MPGPFLLLTLKEPSKAQSLNHDGDGSTLQKFRHKASELLNPRFKPVSNSVSFLFSDRKNNSGFPPCPVCCCWMPEQRLSPSYIRQWGQICLFSSCPQAVSSSMGFRSVCSDCVHPCLIRRTPRRQSSRLRALYIAARNRGPRSHRGTKSVSFLGPTFAWTDWMHCMFSSIVSCTVNLIVHNQPSTLRLMSTHLHDHIERHSILADKLKFSPALNHPHLLRPWTGPRLSVRIGYLAIYLIPCLSN